ncbi:MAG: MBL fold metallo-hydrolase [Candidatus Sungbacteria bacterium]|nr:MBL fold metallo-hydrolase [Candidatus Sungbacteria bacterium]
MEKIKKNAKLISLIILGALAVVIWYAVFYLEGRQNLLVSFFDIGQGDSVFIEVPSGNQILVDGGPSDRILAKLGRAMPFWDRSIDLLILTHPHADHVTGLFEVLKRYDIGMVLESGAEYSTPEYKEWHELLQKKKVPVAIAHAGEKLILGKGTILDVLSPWDNYVSVSLKNPHDANIVGRLTYGQNSILLMGDAERPIEQRLLFESLNSKFIILDSDILKVGHHGSKTSSSEDFLRVVSPKVAIIQAGRKNRYGHPTQEVLDRLAAVGAKILRNDLEGDIFLASDGTSYSVKSK